jgi:hypothetical protein
MPTIYSKRMFQQGLPTNFVKVAIIGCSQAVEVDVHRISGFSRTPGTDCTVSSHGDSVGFCLLLPEQVITESLD